MLHPLTTKAICNLLFGAFVQLFPASAPGDCQGCMHCSLGSARTYSLEADVGEAHSSEGRAHLPPHDGAVAHVALEGRGRGRQRRRSQHHGGHGQPQVECHRGRDCGGGGCLMTDGVAVVSLT